MILRSMTQVFNFIIELALIYGFNYLGWLHLHPSLRPLVEEVPLFVTATLVAVCIFVVQHVISLLRDRFFDEGEAEGGCCLFQLAAMVDIFGGITGGINAGVLYLIATFLPRSLTLTPNFSLNLLMGILLALEVYLRWNFE